MTDKPLQGVKVVDLTYYIAGPGAARILADWGAEVVKVEPPDGEPGRATGIILGLPANDGINPYFSCWNFNKRAIALNLKSPEGVEIMDRLLSEANVFVTSFRPGALKKLGLDYDTLSKKHPHIVWASLNGFGDYGPAKDKAGFDTVAFWARSGAMMDLIEKDTAPVIPILGFGDATTACSLSGGICAGLYRQAITGKGSKINVSLFGQAIWNLSSVIASAQYGDFYPKSRKSPNSAVVNSYQTKDGNWIFMSVFDYERQLPQFLKVIDREDLLSDDRFKTSEVASINSKAFTAIIEVEFAKHSQDEMIKRLVTADIAHEKIQHAADIIKDPQAIANNNIVEVTHNNGEKTMSTVPPVTFGTIDYEMKYGSPIVGEHTEAVLKEIGYTETQINDLLAKKIIASNKYVASGQTEERTTNAAKTKA